MIKVRNQRWALLLLLLGGMVMTPSSRASAADSDTGAPAGSNLERYLKAQDLKVEDIEANRAGNVSPRQAAIAAKHRGHITSSLFVALGIGIVGSLLVAFFFYRQYHKPIYFAGPAGMVVLGGLVYLVYTVLRFPLLDGKRVVMVEGRPDFIRYLTTRDEYSLQINGVKYTGFGRIDDHWEGLQMKVYVYPEKKVIVGVEPVDGTP